MNRVCVEKEIVRFGWEVAWDQCLILRWKQDSLSYIYVRMNHTSFPREPLCLGKQSVSIWAYNQKGDNITLQFEKASRTMLSFESSFLSLLKKTFPQILDFLFTSGVPFTLLPYSSFMSQSSPFFSHWALQQIPPPKHFCPYPWLLTQARPFSVITETVALPVNATGNGLPDSTSTAL